MWCGNFDIILGPFLAHHWRCTALHAPEDLPGGMLSMLYFVAVVIGC